MFIHWLWIARLFLKTRGFWRSIFPGREVSFIPHISGRVGGSRLRNFLPRNWKQSALNGSPVWYEWIFLKLEQFIKILYPKLVCFGYHFLENFPFFRYRNKVSYMVIGSNLEEKVLIHEMVQWIVPDVPRLVDTSRSTLFHPFWPTRSTYFTHLVIKAFLGHKWIFIQLQ